MSNIAPATPTQVAHPWRATARTGFAVLVALAAMLPAIVSASGLDETAAPVAGALAIAAAVTRVMALPVVDEFLRRFLPFLATEPPPPIAVASQEHAEAAGSNGPLRPDVPRQYEGEHERD